MKNTTEKEDRRKEKREKGGANGLILQIILSLVSIGVGALLLFVPGTQSLMLCYIFCGGLVAAGVILVARFFITKAFNRLHDYSVSFGILFLILGVCGLLRIDVIDSHFQLTCGFLLLVLGVMILQGMVQLNVVDNLFWILLMLFTTVRLVASVILILDVQAVIALVPGLLYYLLLGTGIASLLSLLIVSLSLFLYRRKRRKMEEAGITDEDEEEEDIPELSEEVPAQQEAPSSAANAAGMTPDISFEQDAADSWIDQLAGFAQDDSVPTGETQVYPPIAGSAAQTAAQTADAVAEEAAEHAAQAAEKVESVKKIVDTADLPNIAPPESL